MPVSLFYISKLLVQLLRTHSRVSLPGVGAFITEHKPATIVNEGKTILPPSKTVVFRTGEKWNDGFLENIFAEQDGISTEEAKSQLAQFAKEIIGLLKEGQSLDFPDFGTMQLSAEGKYLFEKDAELNLLPDSFGLPELEVNPIANPLIVAEPTVVPAKETESVKPIQQPEKEKNQKNKKSSNKRYYWWIIVIIVLAVVAFFVERSISDFNDEQQKIQQQIQNLSAVESTLEQVPVLVETSEALVPESDSTSIIEQE